MIPVYVPRGPFPRPPAATQQPQYRQVRQNINLAPALSMPLITIIVGPPGASETFLVQDALLRRSSPHFNEMLSRPCKESTERLIRLHTTSVDSFNTYVQFLGSGRIYTFSDGDLQAMLPSGTTAQANAKLQKCASLYHLSDTLELLDFKDAIVDAIIEVMLQVQRDHPGNKQVFTAETVRFFYAYSTPRAGIRKFLVDWAVKYLDLGDRELVRWIGDQEEFLEDFMSQERHVLRERSEGLDVIDPFRVRGGRRGFGEERPECRYHNHGVGGLCYVDRYDDNYLV